ncbi:MAG: hypothetical protein NUW37_09255 [Planctomycetes bacterium]|nr:hypothetical protein [Planctomycetota bacterium]
MYHIRIPLLFAWAMLTFFGPSASAEAPRYEVVVTPDYVTCAPGAEIELSVKLYYRGREVHPEGWGDFAFTAEAGVFRDNIFFAPLSGGTYQVRVHYKLGHPDNDGIIYVRVDESLGAARRANEIDSGTDTDSGTGETPRDLPADKLLIVPAEVYVSPGDSVQFRVRTISGYLYPARAVRWSIEGSGHIDETGRFVASETGEVKVSIAHEDGRSASATAHVQSSRLARIEIDAPDVALGVGSRVQLRAFAYDSNGGLVDQAFNWQASGGTVSDDGIFTATRAGRAAVVVYTTDSNVSASAVFTVVRKVPRRIEVHPSISHLAPGETIGLQTFGVDGDGNLFVVQAEYLPTAGTVDEHGNFHAPENFSGRIHIVAYHPESRRRAVATVEIIGDALEEVEDN